jgi:formimidoylglutamate deiminase
MHKLFHFKALRQADGWLTPAFVGIDEKGLISYLSNQKPQNADNEELVEGFAVPSFPNAHSHAFQYAMVGLTERHQGGNKDNFWTWREAMYQLALNIKPEEMEAVATMLYAEMLRQGYTQVTEFHYLHHNQQGVFYENPAEMSLRILSAAKTAGIKCTIVPIYYQRGGFGQAPSPRQKRFICKNQNEFERIVNSLKKEISQSADYQQGIGFHSLRAIAKEEVADFIQSFPNEPLHLHIAEQEKEIEDAMLYLGKRPVEWLFTQTEVNERFNLVHATHLTENEVLSIAQSGANVVICPTTEGNLGDGFFKLKDYHQAGGRWSIGSDSHIGINPLEELRWLDYGQRLQSKQRISFPSDNQVDMGEWMLAQSVLNGRQAAGMNQENVFFAIGQSLDCVVLDANYPLFAESSLDNIISTWVYASDSTAHLGTMVSGKWLIKNQQHIQKEAISLSFKKAIRSLANRL